MRTVVLALLLAALASAAAKPTVADARAFMDKAESELLDLTNEAQRSGWIEETYITQDTEAESAKSAERLIARTTELVDQARQFDGLKLPPELAREFLLMRLSLPLPAPHEAELRARATQVAASLDGSYGAGKYCPNGDISKCIGIDEIDVRMAKSRDPKELAELWAGWHKIGAPMRERYADLVKLSNQGAREIGFADTGALWRAGYDMPADAFSADLERLWTQVQPLYRELHTYVRRKLVEKYGADAKRADGMIPAHLLGNMWAQEWGNIYDIAAPAESYRTADIGETLQEKHVDAKGVVTYGEHFFQSLGFDALPATFWERSQLTKPRDRDVVCHASAWDVDNDKDVRLKVCLHVTTDDFTTVHHELGHNYYQMAYRTLPFLFRNGANDGFHEAIGDSIALSITPEYLKKVGLLDSIPPPEADIPLLLRTAMDKVAALPWMLVVDKWRWEVFAGEVKAEYYNEAWWRLREKYQGVAPPVDRSEADFDPGAKYHIPSNTPYVRYFLARIYQFQFYKAMCDASGYKGPLNRCSFFGSKEAGAKLNAMLKMGASKPWPEAMRVMTGEDKADAGPMLEYFAPLLRWLKEQNKGQSEGWTVSENPLKSQ
jgi:peptidyl-dipeptidase A